MRITKWRSVCNHDAGIAMLPESPLIRPADTRNERWQSGAFGRNSCMFTKESYGAAQQRARRNVGNESDEVTNRGIKDTESGCGISLRVWRVTKIADRLQTNHRANLDTAGFAPASVNKTSHLFAEKISRLFIHKSAEPERVLILGP